MTFVVINPQMSELAYGTHLFEGVYHSISLKVNIGGGHTLLVWLNGWLKKEAIVMWLKTSTGGM